MNLPFFCITQDSCHYIKAGTNRFGDIRYKCVECKKNFIEADEPVPFETWTEGERILSREVHLFHLWKGSYDKLKAYQQEHGHTWPSQRNEDLLVKRLAMWTSSQRSRIRKGRLHPIQVSLMKALNLGTDYYSNTDKRAKEVRQTRIDQSNITKGFGAFMDGVESVMLWKKTYLRWPAQRKHADDAEKYLARVVNGWRLRRSRGQLDSDRIKLLNTHKFVWDMEDHKFAIRVKHLKRFFKKHKTWSPKNPRHLSPYDRGIVVIIRNMKCRTPRIEDRRKTLISIGFPVKD